MASDDIDQDLDIPQIAIAGVLGQLDDSPFLSAPSRTSPLLDSSRLHPSLSPTDNHGSSLSSLTPILRSSRNSLDTFGSLSHVSDNSSLPTTPSPTFSAHSSTSSSDSTSNRLASSNTILVRERKPEEHYGSPSLYLGPPSCGHRRKGSAASSIGRRSETGHAEDKNSNMPSSRAALSDLTTTHVADGLDAGLSAGSRPSSVRSFFRRTIRRVRRASDESDKSSDATRNGGQKGDNADVRRKGAQLLDSKQGAKLAFFQKASTVLDMEERLEAAKTLHDDAVDLHTFYESGTVAAMQDLRATGKAVSCFQKSQTDKTFDFQEFRAHFHRTVPYSAR